MTMANRMYWRRADLGGILLGFPLGSGEMVSGAKRPASVGGRAGRWVAARGLDYLGWVAMIFSLSFS